MSGTARTEHERERLNGGRVGGELIEAPWRFGLSYRGLRRKVQEVEPGAGELQVGDTRGAHAVAGVATFEQRWILIGAGPAWRNGRGLSPAGILRLGPADLVFLEAARLDFTPAVPGPGEMRAGVGVALGRAHLFAGWAFEDQRSGLCGAGIVPVSERLSIQVESAVNLSRPSTYLLLGAGLIVTLP